MNPKLKRWFMMPFLKAKWNTKAQDTRVRSPKEIFLKYRELNDKYLEAQRVGNLDREKELAIKLEVFRWVIA